MTSHVQKSLQKFRVEMILGHKLKVCTCHEAGCKFCDGGLAFCERCRGGEIELQESCADRLAVMLADAQEQLAFALKRNRDLTIIRDALARTGGS